MNTAPFTLRGVVEGFYGAFYTFPQRNDLIRFIGRHGFNFYLYGPKNDRQHRMRWWDPYPPAILDEFARSIAIAQKSGVTFCYAISFGVPVNYASADDFGVITKKLGDFFDRGCRSFAVLFDDLTDALVHEANQRHFKSVAHAHADFCNRLFAWLRSLDESCSLYLCPTEYWGTAPFGEYLHDLGSALHPDVDVFYTGPAICSAAITSSDAAEFAEVVGRPPVIWDNFPANDLQMRPELHIGPVHGRDPRLHRACKGFVSNLMNQPEASKIALLTISDYLRDPCHYDPEVAWKRALLRLAGADSYTFLRHFAESSLGSPLGDEEAPELTRLVEAVLAALERGESVSGSTAIAALSQYIDVLDESCYHLKNRMRNLALRHELLPWIEALDDKIWLGRQALRALGALEDGADYRAPLEAMEELLANIEWSRKRIGGTSLLALAHHVRGRAAEIIPTPMRPASRARMSTAALDSGSNQADVA